MHRQELNFLSALFSWPLLQKSAPKKRIGKVYFLLPLFLGLFSNSQPLKNASAKTLPCQYSFFMASSPIANPQKMHRQKLCFCSTLSSWLLLQKSTSENMLIGNNLQKIL